MTRHFVIGEATPLPLDSIDGAKIGQAVGCFFDAWRLFVFGLDLVDEGGLQLAGDVIDLAEDFDDFARAFAALVDAYGHARVAAINGQGRAE
jgi:hypothetical protein